MEWILAIGGFALGMVGGIFLGQGSGGSEKIRKQVEEDLQAVQDELSSYRNEVTMHFSKTAGLFNAVTSDYQKLYQHLADGAQHFSQPDALLPDAVTKLVPLASPVESDEQNKSDDVDSVEQVDEQATSVAEEGDSLVESQSEKSAVLATTDEGEAGQVEGVATKAGSGTEVKNADSEAVTEQPISESVETQVGLQEEVTTASGKKAEESAASQPSSDTDTFTVPVSEKETEKRIH